ncbi:hypothetical protein GCM10011578_084920 [Streptomyces fuscichromogenes]|uniref:Uncharacterized protein n=1 Tax=Streptomyces fuscichromogenes TaxID=1324013 RepID=A0A917XN58_9ACTN|nr:hypothetical protein GCM10011578_084920 [Streptomyces fuscichromogenes]
MAGTPERSASWEMRILLMVPTADLPPDWKVEPAGGGDPVGSAPGGRAVASPRCAIP